MDDVDDDYEFEYEDDGEAVDEDMDIENEYYNAKSVMDADPAGALEGFRKILETDGDRGRWSFKAAKRIVKLLCRLARFAEMSAAYEQVLSFTTTSAAVTRNDAEKAINSILDSCASMGNLPLPVHFEILQATMRCVTQLKIERLLFSTLLRLGKLAFEAGNYSRVQKVLRELRVLFRSDAAVSGAPDARKGTQLLEVYALEIMLWTALKDNKRLAEAFEASMKVQSAIPHPRIMAVIREGGGKMYMMEGRWAEANKAFFDAFKNYDEAGHPRRIQCLKYLVLSSMLMGSNIDPFHSQEAKPYQNDPQILAMTALLEAYENGDIHAFEAVLRSKRDAVMGDDFLRDYFEELLTNIRLQVLQKLVRPFSSVRFAHIAQELNVSEEQAHWMCAFLLAEGKIVGRLDETSRVLLLQGAPVPDDGLASLVSSLRTLEQAVSRLTSLS